MTSQGQRPRHPHRTPSEAAASVWGLGRKPLLRTAHLQHGFPADLPPPKSLRQAGAPEQAEVYVCVRMRM